MQVQIVSDIVCPWCRIGKNNLMDAGTEFTKQTGEPLAYVFLPYLLNPITPEEEGKDYRQSFLDRKGMTAEQMSEMFARVTEVGEQFGLTFNFDAIKIAVNTVPAHELMELTPPEHRLDVMDALMTAWFEHGKNVGDPDVLLQIAEPVVGKETAEEIAPALRAGAAKSVVLDSIQQVQQAGVRSVPYTIIDNKLTVSGGQPPQAFLGALMQAWEARKAMETPG